MIQWFCRTAAVLVFILSLAGNAQAAEIDVDADGRSDILIIDITASGLVWFNAASAQSFAQASNLGSLGKNGDLLTPGSWLAAASPQIGVASHDSKTGKVSITVSNNGQSSVVEVGQGGDIIISGGDYDGNGVLDTVAVNSGGAAKVKLNPFAGGSESAQLNFAAGAASSAQGLFINRSGTKDEIGLVKTRKIGKRNYYLLKASDIQKNKFSKRYPSSKGYALVDAVPIAQSNGVDSLLFYEKRGSRRRVSVFNLKGGRQYGAKQSRGTLLVGDYLADAGEEFAIYSNGNLRVFNPFTSTATTFSGLPNGVPADHVNVEVFEGSGGSDDTGGGGDAGGGDAGEDVQGCNSVRSFPTSTHIYKTVGSSHFNDIRRNTSGLIIRPGASGPFPSCIYIMDTKGNKLGAMGLYQTGGGWAARYYAGIGCGSGSPYSGSTFASKARANTGNPNILFNFGSFCLGPINAGQCIGSSQC